MLMKLPRVESLDMLQFIRNGLMSVIDSGPIFYFYHKSFEDFLFSFSFLQVLPKLSDVQNQNLCEYQLAILCLNCLVSLDLHFNMCNLKSLNIENVDIPVAFKSGISSLISYLSQFWADYLISTKYADILIKAVEFVIYKKLLFWIKVMSILEKAHKVSTILKQALK